MKRLISGLSSVIIFFSTCSGYVVVEKDIKKEEILSFNFTGSEDEIVEYIDISEYVNAQIVDYGMNKGKAKIKIEDDEVRIDMYDGKYTKGEEIREKIKTEEIEMVAVKDDKYVLIPDKDIVSIEKVDGDFEEVKIVDEKIILTVSDEASGEEGYNRENIVKSEIEIEISEDNCEEIIYSDWYSLEERDKNSKIKIKNVSLNGDATIEVDDNMFRVLFKNGTPKLEQTMKKDTHSYYWIDRALDGTFREEYPNSIYRTDRYYFEGRGTYIDDERLIMDIGFEDEWQDYVGFIIDNQKYVYPLKDSFPKELFNDSIIMKENTVDFEKYWLNTEELTVEVTEDSIRYIPRGILYSMGELVAYSEDWGETVPNNPDESTESFYNNISERMETYVKHFKFFYGPKVKETFGGTFKYPYKAIIEYEHYEPTNLYSGSVTYKYEELEEVDGYLFDGWVKISYTEREKVNDYPPTAPYNVFYDNSINELTWSAGKDDYTSQKDLIYEIEVKIDNEFCKIFEIIGDTELNYENGKDQEFRVRAKDQEGQVSEWAYSNDSDIEITAQVFPNLVKAGENINISAIVKSLHDVEEVRAVSEELNINEVLTKKSEIYPNATEIVFSLLDCVDKESSIVVNKMYCAEVDSNKEINMQRYPIKEDVKKAAISIELPKDIYFMNNGTIILPNQNYLDMPIEIIRFNNKWWYFYSMCDLKFINKSTGKEESFISFVNDTTVTKQGSEKIVEVNPYIKINLFEYIDGTPTYEKIPISMKLAGKPISVVWNSKNNLTSFTIYVDNTCFYSYEVETNKIKENINKFSKYSLDKSMDRMRKTTLGYTYDNDRKHYYWANMYEAGSLAELPFLGYKLSSSYDNENFKQYNNLTTTRDVNRLVFLDEAISFNTIQLYLDKIKSTNIMMQKRLDTIFVKDIQEITSNFNKSNIKIPSDIKEGKYDIVISAVDKMGNIGFTTLQVEIEKQTIVEKKKNINIGRYYHVDNNISKKAVEELSLTKYNLDTEGFISAGETLAILIDKELEIDNIVIDIEGDVSIKQYDKLTETFLEKNPGKYGKVNNIKENYKFPSTIYPNEYGVFLYTIPYGTKQSLESWYTLRQKSDDYESINKDKLFSRINKPYKLKVYINGNKENTISFDFDVFERWDTILNRDASNYIINSGSKWRILL